MSAPLREGYKQTEVGVIPVEWTLVRFADLFEFRNGVNAEKHAYGKGTRFINVLEVITHSHLRADDIPGRISLSKSAINAFSVQYGDIVFNRTSETQEEVGLSAVYWDAEPVVFGGFVIRGRPKSDVLDVGYSGDALRAPIIRSQVIAKGQGAIRSNVGQADLRQVLAPLPPLPEQRAIAAALSDVDALISAQDALIAKKRDLKQAAMQELLTGKQRLPGFSGGWEVKRLGEVLRVRHGKSQHDVEVVNGAYPILATGGEIGRTNHYLYDKPSVLIGRKGTIDAPQYLDTPFWTIDTLFFTEIMGGISAKFIFYKFNMINWRSYNEASGVPSLNASTIENVEIKLPNFLEQTAIATILSDMDAEIAGLCARRDKTRALKQGMMQELLTGRIRLV